MRSIVKTTRILALLGAMGVCCSWSLLGCAVGGDIDEDGEQGGEDFSPEDEVGEVDQPVIIRTLCGIWPTDCGFGSRFVGVSCDPSCGSCTADQPNSTQCQVSLLTTCGSSCPSGYRVTSSLCQTSCGACSTSAPNAVSCLVIL